MGKDGSTNIQWWSTVATIFTSGSRSTQTVGEKRKCCYNILKLRLDPVAGIKNRDLKSVVVSSNMKSDFALASKVLKNKIKESYKPAQ